MSEAGRILTAVAILDDLDKGLWRGLQLVRMRELAKAPAAALESDFARCRISRGSPWSQPQST